jgi:hypothetical protein
MKQLLPLITILLLTASTEAADKIVARLKEKGITIYQDRSGKPIRLMSKGQPIPTLADYRLINKIQTIESMGFNASQLKNDEWDFLRQQPQLKRLAIWHAQGISSLAGFTGLKVESLTIGGCMGIRDHNRNDPAKHRDAVLTLKNLPNLKSLSLYHTPLTADDSHITHIVKEFPQLTELRLDFATPRGTAVDITPPGLTRLHGLPLVKLTIENIHPFAAAHMEAIATIPSLKILVIDARKKPVAQALVEAVKAARPDLKVDLQQARK